MEAAVLSKPHRYKYDVFLSFGSKEDNFSERLYNALRKEVRVFRNNNKGTEINKSLFAAMEDSAASIVIFTRHYADSIWCLDELAMLCDLGTSLDRPILPIFYKVDPSHVRKQSDPFANDFEQHAERFSKEEVQRWRDAMKLVGNLAGYVYRERTDEVEVEVEAEDEDDIIKLVVKKVLAQVSNTPEKVGEYTVGLESRVQDLMELVDVKSTGDVQILGLYGMGGIGKTTLAKRFYNLILENFEEHRAFISNVSKESSGQDGLLNLQQSFIKSLFGSVPEIEDVNNGWDMIRGRVREKKILVVLDDVDNVNQVDALVGERSWYGEGSVIIMIKDFTLS